MFSTFQAGNTIYPNLETGPSKALNNFFSFGAQGQYTDRPTITYVPLTGSQFVQTLMTPIPPVRLFELVEAGWRVDLLFVAAVQTVNGLSNSRGGAQLQSEDPEFVKVVKSLRRIQASGTVGLRADVTKDKKGEGLVMFFGAKKSSTGDAGGAGGRKTPLGLNPEKTEFSVIYGAVPAGRDDVIALAYPFGIPDPVRAGDLRGGPRGAREGTARVSSSSSSTRGSRNAPAVDSYCEWRHEADRCVHEGVLQRPMVLDREP